MAPSAGGCELEDVQWVRITRRGRDTREANKRPPVAYFVTTDLAECVERHFRAASPKHHFHEEFEPASFG